MLMYIKMLTQAAKLVGNLSGQHQFRSWDAIYNNRRPEFYFFKIVPTSILAVGTSTLSQHVGTPLSSRGLGPDISGHWIELSVGTSSTISNLYVFINICK